MARSIPGSIYWLLASVAVCAVIAVVGRQPLPNPRGGLPSESAVDRPNQDDGAIRSHEQTWIDEPHGTLTDDALTESVRSAVRWLRSRDGLDWRVISRIETPWGPDTRLRPWHGTVEMRGLDVRVISGQRLLFEQPRYDGDRLRREAARLEGMIGSGSGSGHRSSSPHAAVLGQNSPFAAFPSAVLLVSGDEVALAYEAVLTAAANPEDRLAAVFGLGGSRSGAVDSGDAGPGTAEFRSELPLPDDSPLPVLVILDSESGVVREVWDLRRGSAGEAHIFDPNPVATSGVSGLRDGDPVEQYRVWVPVERLDPGGALVGRWVRVRTDLGPTVNEPNRVYDYLSTDPRFEQAMAYVHGDRSLQRAEDLGFVGLFPTPIGIVAHGTRLDNSWYIPPTREIILGSGGVDDAEDGDIILHETGHAIHDALVPGFGGGDTRAISEGFADFWAASLTGDACVGDWDATSYGPPCLRRVDDDVVYPTSITGSVHKDGRLFSALLWDLRGAFGAETGERLALASLREQAWDSTWEEVGESVLRAADRLGIPRSSVEPHLARRGFLSRILSVDLAGTETARVELPNSSSFLGKTTLALDVSGDGKIQFVDTRGAGPTPSPWFAPYAPEDSADLTLRGRGEMDGSVLVIDFAWVGPDDSIVLRSRTEWDTENGGISWCLLDAGTAEVTTPSALRRFYSGCEIGDGEVAAIDWNAGDRSDWSDLTGFRGVHERDLGAGVGEQWELRHDGNGAFDLRRSSVGRTLDARSQVFAQPSPFRERTEIRLYVPTEREVEVTVHGADGRLLRRIAREWTERGLRTWEWNGLDERGQELPSGRYWIRARGTNTNEVVSVVRIR